jgi:quinohemoprotein ethanol dehydrogenase
MRNIGFCLLLGMFGALAVGSLRLSKVAGMGANWAAYGADADETRFSPLTAINSSNIDRLGLGWSLDLPGEVSLAATPLALDGVLYFTGSYGKVYAVNGDSGKLIWTHDPEVWKHNPAKMRLGFAVNRGVAHARGRIFAAAFDGRLYALDAHSGQLLWSVETVGRDSYEFISGAPRAFNDLVIIGSAGADFGVRGYVTAYDQATGAQRWRFYVAPGTPEQNRGDPAMERAAATWRGEYWKTGTGGGVWDSITFDTRLNRIYLGTGNAGPSDPAVRSPGGGDNLYTASIVALDADTGRYAWHYQVNPRDAWDYDSTQQMTLATLLIDGQPRDVLMQAPKNGFYYVIDRHTGRLISAEKIGKVTWAERIDLATGRPVEAPGIRYESGETFLWPNPTGAHNWQAMSYSPASGLVYIPYMQNGVHFYRGPAKLGDVFVAGLSIGSNIVDPEDGKGALLAWDPVRQQPRWKVQHDTIWNGGTLATAGNLVFQGTGDGRFSAYDAISGKRIWRFDAGLGIIAPPISYQAHGRQYIALLVGYGSAAAIGSDVMRAGWRWGAPRRLLSFALDGKAALPAMPPRDNTVHALDDPGLKLNEADVAAGKSLYMNCVVCHGRDAVSAGAPAPDLRESAIALDPKSFWSVVHEGSLLPAGMPRFDMLSQTEVNQIHAYIRSRARIAMGGTSSPPH